MNEHEEEEKKGSVAASLFLNLFFDFPAGGDGEFSISPADAPALGIANESLVLAEGRTARRDPLNNFYTYRDGWDIRNQHYWAVSAPSFCLLLS